MKERCCKKKYKERRAMRVKGMQRKMRNRSRRMQRRLQRMKNDTEIQKDVEEEYGLRKKIG